MPTLPGAQNVLIHQAKFTEQNIATQYNLSNGPSGIDILLQASTPAAAHDSSIRHPPPTCFPGTREQYIEDITRWGVPSLDHDPLPMYWMNGPAGVGKTAVAQTCAEKLKEQGRLGAAFFFSINSLDEHTRFFTTIAYQLSTEFPDYRYLLDLRICRDKTIVDKAMVWQFKALIAEPIQELMNNGKGIEKRAIFIDGLDQCIDKNAQCEIIEIISASVRERSTPFCWAFFCRAESHIEATFGKDDIAPYCHLTTLPISRAADKEIELYLRSGLQNVLRRRNLSLSFPWPSDKDIETLIDASGGLFIYPATVLRYVDRPGRLGPVEQLNVVLASVSGTPASAHGEPKQPFAELDAFYTLILQRISDEMLPSIQLLLATMFRYSFHPTLFWGAVHVSNQLRFSESGFKTICNELRAVLHFHEHHGPLEYGGPIDSMEALKYASLKDFAELQHKSRVLGGAITLYHKSFWDFLHDPNRSHKYCISTPEIYNQLLEHHIELWRSCQECFEIQKTDSGLSLRMISEPAAALSWPLPDRFVSTYVHARSFNMAGATLSTLSFCHAPNLRLLRRVADLDHLKHLLNQTSVIPGEFPVKTFAYECDAIIRCIRNTLIRRIPPATFDKFNTAFFDRMVERFQKAKAIRPYYPTFTSRLKSFFQGLRLNASKSKNQSRVKSGLYTMGRGSKKVYWFWMLDLEARYFNEYYSNDWAEGERLYREQDFGWWESSAMKAKGVEQLELEKSGDGQPESGGSGNVEHKVDEEPGGGSGSGNLGDGHGGEVGTADHAEGGTQVEGQTENSQSAARPSLDGNPGSGGDGEGEGGHTNDAEGDGEPENPPGTTRLSPDANLDDRDDSGIADAEDMENDGNQAGKCAESTEDVKRPAPGTSLAENSSSR